MAHIPALRALANLPAKDVPGYITSNANSAGVRSFIGQFRDWYFEKYIAPGRINPLFHFMFASSVTQAVAVSGYHKLKHHAGHH